MRSIRRDTSEPPERRAGREAGKQVVGVVATIAFVAAASWAILKLVDALVGLRVDRDAESAGLDLSQHSESAYGAGSGAHYGGGGGGGAPSVGSAPLATSEPRSV